MRFAHNGYMTPVRGTMLTDHDYIYGHRYGDGDHSGIRCPACGSANIMIVPAGRDDREIAFAAVCRACGEEGPTEFSAREAAQKWEEF
jgi:predicted RNA-binding Zn-ribbon protein involved in translation (DUF1610 family)